MRVVLDTSPLRLTQAGTARYIRNLLCPASTSSSRSPSAAPAAPAVLGRELWWYPFRLSLLADADLLHCPTYYGPVRPRLPSIVTVHDLAVLRHPEAFPRWTRRYVPRAVPRVLRAAARVIAVSEFTAVGARRAPVASRASEIVVVPNAVDPIFTPDGPRADGDYVLAVGTLEPRKNLARTIERRRAPRRRAARRRRARLGRRRAERRARPLARRARRRGARRAVPRRALRRLPVAVRGLRDPDARGDGVRHPGRHLRPRGDARRSQAARRCSSTLSTSPAIARGMEQAVTSHEGLRERGLAPRGARSRGTRRPAARAPSTRRLA